RHGRLPPGVKDLSDLYVGDPAGFLSRWRRLCDDAWPLFVTGRAAPPPREQPQAATDSQKRRQQGRPRLSPPAWKPFPIHCLPPIVRDRVAAAAASIGCDPAMVALPELATIAATIGNTRCLTLKRGWSEPSCLWAVVVAESGAQRSPAFDAAVGPLQQLQ